MNKTIFIGQAMPRVKMDPHDWPSLNRWLYSIGIDDAIIKEKFLYSALVNYFPGAKNGSHVVPSKEEIEDERRRLVKTILSFNPKLLVPVGRISISYCLDQKVTPLKNHIGKIYKIDPYLAMKRRILVIPFPHPSGASSWKHKKENKILLHKALTLLKNNL